MTDPAQNGGPKNDYSAPRNHKTLGWVIGIVLAVVVIGGMIGDGVDDGSSATAGYPVAAASYEEENLAGLAEEGSSLANEVTRIAQQGTAAAEAGDLQGACDAYRELDPKVDRLGEIVAEMEDTGIQPDLVADADRSYQMIDAGRDTMAGICG